MTVWIIEPQDPLIARDGRPFDATPGVRARSLPFPYPSTTAGGVRTRAGQVGNAVFNTELVDEVLALTVRGPLPAEYDKDGRLMLMAPAPGDALLFDEGQDRLALKRLAPQMMPDGAQSDLPAPLQAVVGLASPDSRKSSRSAPRFWYWDAFERWLLDPVDELVEPQKLGHSGPQPDQRTHVAIDPRTLAGLEGMLFMTSGLTFWVNKQTARLSDVKRMALVVEARGYSDELAQHDGYGALGGERRLMYWRASADGSPFPSAGPPEGLAARIAQTGHCRVILLTPGYFEAGWLPDVARWAAHGVQPQLLAAVVGKPLVISGWNMAPPRGPKPTRRLAPAGSVYTVQLQGTAAAIEAWVKEMWLRCLSDDAADRAAGFGLAVIGAASAAAEEES